MIVMNIKGFIKASNEHDREKILEAAARKAQHLRVIAETLEEIVKTSDVERLADTLTYSFADVTELRREAAVIAEGTRLIKLIEKE
jgi:SpoVK/Ycf46/Vps4 family AAA+-type ATPase